MGLVWGLFSMGFVFRRCLKRPKKGNVERFSGLFFTEVPVDYLQDFILFSLADAN